MEVSKVKKGKQRLFVSKEVIEMDEETVTGENLFGEPMDSLEVGNRPNIIPMGNLIVDRKKFKDPQEGRVYSAKGCCPTLTLGVPPKILIYDDDEYKVRELSGYEGLMLMGVEKEDIEKLVECCLSNGQMMKLAGNSIIVDVMSSLFKELVLC